MVVGAPESGATVDGLLGLPPQRAIAYSATPDQLGRWESTLPADPDQPGPSASPLDPDGGVRQTILSQLGSLLPDPPAPVPFNAVMTEVPLVRVVLNGQTQYANPNVDDAMFGQSHTAATPTPAPPAGGEREIRIALEASQSRDPAARFTLVEHTFHAQEVASRTVTAAFATPLSRTAAARTRVGDAALFIPMLVVRGDGLDADGTEALSKLGTAVTRDGARVEVVPGAGLVIDGEQVAPGPTPDAMLQSVASLTTSINAVAFPEVEVLVSARTATDALVPGLAADALVLQEDDAAVVANLRRTRAGPTRVVLLFDRSTSIPTEFLDDAPAVGHAIADAVFTQFPGAEIQIAAVHINGPALAGPLVSTLSAVDDELAVLNGTGSELWTSLDGLSGSHATAVVLITDADPEDVLTADMASRLAAGPPVLVAGVGTVDQGTAARIADLTHGQVLTGVTPANLAMSVTSFLAERVGYDYRIIYRSPNPATRLHQLSVGLRMPGTAAVVATYTAPVTPVAAGALNALYLTVETGGHQVTRTLAGSAAGSADDREQVAGALLGRFVLGIEAGSPSFPTLLDEHIAARFQLEAGVDALRANDPVALASAARSSFVRTPPDLALFAAALPDEAAPGDVTFAEGLTVTLHSIRPVLGVKVIHSIDMLPLVPRQTVSFSGGQVYATTTQRTAALAAFESQRFAMSTLPNLTGRTLALFDPLTVDQLLGPAWAGVAYPAYADYHVVAPSDGAVVAFWAVHKGTGQLVGVMPQGGIGQSETQALVDRLTLILDVAGRVGEAYGYEGIKAWADLEATKVELLGGVIMLFEGEGEDPSNALANSMCSAAGGALGGAIPGIGPINLAASDLGALARLIRVTMDREVPRITNPAGAACGVALGSP